MNAFTSTALLATTNLSTPAGDDVDLIRLCTEHIANVRDYNLNGGLGPMDAPDPRWNSYANTRDAITVAVPKTWAGLQAIARAAVADYGIEEGDDNPSTHSISESWAWSLLRTVQRGGIQFPTEPSPDAGLIAVCAEYLRISRAWSAHCAAAGDRDIEADDPALAMWQPLPALVEQIVKLRATTAEGHLARAQCMAFPYLPSHDACLDKPEAAEEDRFEAAQLRDLVDMERGATLLAMPAAGPQFGHPDAELLETCAAFDALERAYVVAGGDHDAGSPEELTADAERRRITDAQEPLVDRMCELRAVTQEGQVARARSLALWDAELMKPGSGDTGQCLTQAIVRDLLAASSPLPSTPDPDAALIAICERGLQLNAGHNALRDQAALDAWRAGHGAEWQDILGDICGTRATTPAGRFAKGRFFSEALNGGEDDISQSLLIDIDAEARRLGLVAPLGADVFPDADLLDKVAAFFSARASRPAPVGAEKIANTPECERYEALLEACSAAETNLFKEALEIPANTIVGLQAKARLVAAWNEHEEHVEALLKDIADWSAVA